MHGRNCSGFSTLASGRWHGKVYANLSHVGKKLRIYAGIHRRATRYPSSHVVSENAVRRVARRAAVRDATVGADYSSIAE